MANVLVIDDDLDVARFLKNQLSEEGHEVTLAHLGDEGLAKALKMIPDLIMLDVFLPDATGFQLCSQLRKNSATHAVPIIMMTGAARFPNQQLYGLERGANEYISKPFNLAEVDTLIHKYIDRKHAPAPEIAAPSPVPVPQPSEDLSALSNFLEQSLARQKAKANGNGKPQVESFESMLVPTPEPARENGKHPRLEDARAEGFTPPIMASKERFVDFGLEIYSLASRLCANEAEKYLGQQLLRSGFSIGARLNEIRSTHSAAECTALLDAAQKDLRDVGYWLGVARKAGVLEIFCKLDLEKTWQSLTTLLNDFVVGEKKHLKS